VLDEPTASLDPESRLEMRDILIQQRQARTIVMTTHYMDEADSVADNIAIMSAGSLVVADSPLALRLLYGVFFCMLQFFFIICLQFMLWFVNVISWLGKIIAERSLVQALRSLCRLKTLCPLVYSMCSCCAVKALIIGCLWLTRAMLFQ
jgi:energy-coupling factor transporter ATP-binding protein EcfA2